MPKVKSDKKHIEIQECCANAKITMRCANKCKQTTTHKQTATPPPKIT